MPPTLTLHVLPPSHPCHTVLAALRIKGLEAEVVTLNPGEHNDVMEGLYGPGKRTVPGMLIDGEPVHGSVAILERLEQIAPEPALYPAAIADGVREAERWGDAELQDLGRRLPWGAMHFRPEALGTFAGGEPMDPAGTDFAIAYIHRSWAYHGITAARLADDLAGLPAKLDHIDELIAAGVVGGESATAADLQIGATIQLFLTLGDLQALLDGRPAARLADWFQPRAGHVPAGAFPAGWVPAAG